MKKKIVLPEGDDLRTVQAANICAQEGIAHLILLGEKNKIQNICDNNELVLSSNLEIIETDTVIDKYITPLCEARKTKGLQPRDAKIMLENRLMLGTMMLRSGDVDGLVAGAVHTTADTIRPALQVIKSKEGASLVSSLFFICLPNQVLLYSDCGLNVKPTAQQLASIAIQTAETATLFGIEPRVAMLSYSTGTSGAGEDVEKVIEATKIVKGSHPNLLIDGPLQYDAAIDPKVAFTKAPNSLVAGKATVLIMPDINAGNIAYKAVQRSTNAIAVGPILQGLRKPVNDLSRGCAVEDVVFAIAVTAVQAGSNTPS